METIFVFLVRVLVVWTGEVVLWAATLGRWRPEFSTSPLEAELDQRPTFWVGLATWAAVVGVLCLLG